LIALAREERFNQPSLNLRKIDENRTEGQLSG
jgi:hypothetical protein